MVEDKGQRGKSRRAHGHARGAVEFRALQRLLLLPQRASRIFAKTCCSITALTRSTFAFPGRIVRQNMLEIPDSVSFLDAAMVEPLACVLRGVA